MNDKQITQLSQEEVNEASRKIACEITQNYLGALDIITFSNGGLWTVANISKYLLHKPNVFSLGNANEIDDVGIIEMLQDGKYPWGFGHNVIIIDDILDSGSTVQKINEEINNFSSIFNESNLFHYFLVSKYPRFSNMYTPKKYFAPISIDDKWIVFPWEQ